MADDGLSKKKAMGKVVHKEDEIITQIYLVRGQRVMLASVLNSPTAIQTSIYIVRAFVKLRELLSMYHELSETIFRYLICI